MLALAVGTGSAIGAALTLPSGFLVGACICGAPWWAPLWMDLTILVFVLGAITFAIELLRLRQLAWKIVRRSERESIQHDVWTQPPAP